MGDVECFGKLSTCLVDSLNINIGNHALFPQIAFCEIGSGDILNKIVYQVEKIKLLQATDKVDRRSRWGGSH